MYDVIVIGAGIAGLAAARALQRHGRRVCVLEARQRVGGRLALETLGDANVDLGAAWLEGVRNNPIVPLCRELGIGHTVTEYETRLLSRNGRDVSETVVDAMEKRLRKALRKTKALASAEADVSLARALRRVGVFDGLSKTERRVMAWLVSTELASEESEDLDRVSLRGYWNAEPASSIGGDHHWFPGAYGELPQLMAAELDVELGMPVQSLRQTSEGVQVFAMGEWRVARRVIVTLPLGVLQREQVAFDPPLSAQKQLAITNVAMGAVNRLVLQFERCFWPADVENFARLSKRPDRFALWTNLFGLTGRPILSLWSHGTAARELDEMRDADIVALAMAQLRKGFGLDVPQPVSYRIARWALDPHAHGAYSYLPVGVPANTRQTLAAPEGHLYFAGEATNAADPATVHGAFVSGERAAEEVHTSLH